MRRKMITIGLIIVMLLSSSIFSFANITDALWELNEEEKDRNSKELSAIESLLKDENKYLISESSDELGEQRLINEYDVENACKVYFAKTLMLTAFEESNNVNSIFLEQYQWYIPINGTEQSVAVFDMKDNEPCFIGISPTTGRYISEEKLIEIILGSDMDIGEISSIKYVYSKLYYTVFAVIYTDSTIYCIPFSSNEEWLGLENERMYVFEEMMNYLVERFDEQELVNNPNTFGGVAFRETPKTGVYVVVIISAMSIIFSAIALVRIKKRKQS